MKASFLRAAQLVPDFFPFLVAEGADPRSLRLISRQMNEGVEQNARAIVAAQMEVPVSRLTTPDKLEAQHSNGYGKLSTALAFGQKNRLATPVHRQLQDLAAAAGRAQPLDLRYPGSWGCWQRHPGERSHLDWHTAQLPRDQWEGATAAYERRRVWERVGFAPPEPRNCIERAWIRAVEKTANRRQLAETIVYKPLGLDVALHAGMATAAVCMSWLPQAFSGSLLGACVATALAAVAGLVHAGGVVHDLFAQMVFHFRHRGGATKNFEGALTGAALDKVWPGLANPFLEPPFTMSAEQASATFLWLRRKAIFRALKSLDHGISPNVEDRNFFVRLEPNSEHFAEVACPQVPLAIADHYRRLEAVAMHNRAARPFLQTQGFLVKFAKLAKTGRGQTTWTACAAALAQAHARRDAWME